MGEHTEWTPQTDADRPWESYTTAGISEAADTENPVDRVVGILRSQRELVALLTVVQDLRNDALNAAREAGYSVDQIAEATNLPPSLVSVRSGGRQRTVNGTA